MRFAGNLAIETYRKCPLDGGPTTKFPTQRTGNFLSGIWEIGEVSSEILARSACWRRAMPSAGLHASGVGNIRKSGAGLLRRQLPSLPPVPLTHSHRAEVCIMRYVSEWELLSDAATRVMEAEGVSKEEAQSDICQAIADRDVKFRGKLEWHTTKPFASKTVLEGTAFQIPSAIKPKDLDWERSRPGNHGSSNAGFLQHTDTGTWSGSSFLGPTLRTFCAVPGRRGESAQPASRETGPTSRSRPAFESAQRVIRELYPQGVPGQAVVPNSNLCRRVGEKLKEQGLLAFQTTRF